MRGLLQLGTLPSLQRLPRPLVLHASLPESGLVASSVFLRRPAVEVDALGFGDPGGSHCAHSKILDGFGQAEAEEETAASAGGSRTGDENRGQRIGGSATVVVESFHYRPF